MSAELTERPPTLRPVLPSVRSQFTPTVAAGVRVDDVGVLVPGAPERAGVAYRPSEYAGALVHDLSGHCYDVDGTEAWRDGDRLGAGQFALPSTEPGENDMMRCPVDEPREQDGV